MHELSIAEAIVEMVSAKAGGRPVEAVRIRVGRLAGVVTESLEFCFALAATGTPLDGATLEIEQPPGAAHCRSCGQDWELADLILLCPCGSADVEVTSGRELDVATVRVEG